MSEHNMSREACPEAAQILMDAGWTPHPNWGVYTIGGLVMGTPPHGQTGYVKNTTAIVEGDRQYSEHTPDTHVEAARWLVAHDPGDRRYRYRRKATAAADPLSQFVETPANAPAVSESQAGSGNDAAPVESAVDSGADIAPEERPTDMGGADGGGAGGENPLERSHVLADDGQDGAGASDEASEIEADFDEIGEAAAALEGADPDYPELEPPSLGAEILEQQAQEPEQGGGVAYFGDDIHVARLAKLGRMMEVATEKKAALQEGWTVAEFASLQNLIVRMSDGTAPEDAAARDRFNFISDKSQAMSRIDAHLDHREQELEGYARLLKDDSASVRDGARQLIVEFDPEAGWPE